MTISFTHNYLLPRQIPELFVQRLRKRYFSHLGLRFRTQTQNHAKGVYIINSEGIAYHQRLAVVYHHCESEYCLRLMICTFGDEIHAKA